MGAELAIGLTVAGALAFMGWAGRRWLRGPDSPVPPLPPELAGRLRELQALAAETQRVVEAHDLTGVMVASVSQLVDLVATARHLAQEQARLRAYLDQTPRKAVEREVARRREKAGGAQGSVGPDRLAIAEQRLALVTRIDEAVAELRERFAAIDETVRLIHAQAVAASAAGAPEFDVGRVARDLESANAALAEVRALSAQRRALSSTTAS